ncbi:putative T7SS-secreted protein [Actinophytocola xinjiangensis]|uniref:putative T7SS-secreted protein n=1 Tax=Actinophytocola xinjiangensis TaxID=485602 RepID=UPI000B1F7D56|nr:EndoU domain-containing protein [Actinophytocola xinjiangensis]
MAELGETTDPKALVPGTPSALRDTARSLGEYGDLLIQVGEGLRTIDDGGWQGPAGDAFRAAFGGEPSRWITCGECFRDARNAVEAHAETLEWAQGEAAVAIDLWEQGEQATANARAAHDQARDKAQREASAAGEPPPPDKPFTDPGEELRQQARDKLDRAREQVRTAGDEAADTVERAQQAAPEEPGWLESAFGGVTDAIGDGLRALGEGIGAAVRDVGEAVDEVLEDIGGAVDSVLDGVGDAVGDVLEDIGDRTGIEEISDAGRVVDEALDDAGDAVDDALDDAGDAVAGATDDAGDAVEDGLDNAGDAVDPDEDDDGVPEDPSNDEDGEVYEGEDPDDDDPDQHDGGDEDHPKRQTGTEWDNAEGDSDDLPPNPEHVYTTPERQDHILDGDPNDEESGGHRYGTGRPNKTEFPEHWDDDDIIENVEDVTRNPDSPPRQLPDGKWEVRGERDGVDIRVIVDQNGSIETAHPTGGDGVVKNDSQGNPHPKPR